MKDLMIDLETMGTKPNCVVLSLGACFFDIATGKIGDTFYMVFEVEEQKAKGRTIEESTMKWWSMQSNAAKRVFTDKKVPVAEVLQKFVEFVQKNGTVSKIYPWGNGSTFDISIIENLMEQYGVKVPWLFYNVMDLRTFVRFQAKGIKVPKLEGVNHHALDDAINQAKHVMKFCGVEVK